MFNYNSDDTLCKKNAYNKRNSYFTGTVDIVTIDLRQGHVIVTEIHVTFIVK
uniref:Uncharacterized protein n=1 Tax=Rhizophagus irregularis (strain DAOM 181602 / DAOM 197198 / MUCL 43194) TaxID=747089 RepID=U9UAE2_RHIID